MRTAFSLFLCVLVLGGVALAQGAGGADKKTIAQKLTEQAAAGPGYVQQEFFNDFKSNLVEEFGDDMADDMWSEFTTQQLTDNDVLQMVNGNTTKSQLQDYLGCSYADADKADKALDKTVAQKNRKFFFGIMIFIMVVDFDMDPTSEFCQQAVGAKDEISNENFDKMLKGNVSVTIIQMSFGFQDKEDCKFMQDILNMLMQSPFVNHPMASSMGMGDVKKYDPTQFPQQAEGMPGFGEEFGGGMAGGMPFDQGLPPCPFCGGNLAEMFGAAQPPQEQAQPAK